MRSSLQETMLTSLAVILRPIVKLLLQAGLGYSEFSAVAKTVFIQVATLEYGLRGRPTNASRVSAMTGISRKEVSRFHKAGELQRWTPNMETTPINTILHFWHHDPEFCFKSGTPRPLPLQGDGGFEALVSKYAGDIPAGAIKASLLKAGSVVEDDEGRLVANEAYFSPMHFNEDFVRGLGFALANLGGTLVHNAALRRRGLTREQTAKEKRFEVTVWSEYLDADAKHRFKLWVDAAAQRFLEQANAWIGANELPKEKWSTSERRSVGVSVYHFEEE